MVVRALRISAALMLFAFVSPASAQPRKFSLEVTPKRATVDDTFVATVIIEIDGVTGAERYWQPGFRAFHVSAQPVKTDTSMRIAKDGGQRLVSREVRRYLIKAKRPGNLFIDPARIRLRGKDYETKGAYLVVRPSRGVPAGVDIDPGVAPTSTEDPTAPGGIGAPGFRPPDPSRREPVFLHAVADKRSVYQGEQVTVSWLLYTRDQSGVLRFEPRPPALDGLWAETLYEPSDYFRYFDTLLGRFPYKVTIVSKRAIFPTRIGRTRVRPFVGNVVTARSNLGRGERVRSSSVYLRVKALPRSAPKGFDPSYVGDFRISAEIDKPEIEAGASALLTVTVEGSGAIARTVAPKLNFDGIMVRKPREHKETISVKEGKVVGKRVYQYWLTPQVGGEQVLPAIELPYFDPKAKQYRVASSKPIPIVVSGDPSAVLERDPGAAQKNMIQRDIRLIRRSASIESRVLPSFYRAPWFVVLLLLPPLAYLGIVVVDFARRRTRQQTSRARIRQARGSARKRFRVATIHLRGGRPAKFFGELSRVIYQHLEHSLERPVSSLTREELRVLLSESGFSKSTVEQVQKELEHCDFARFSPSAISDQEMRDSMERVRTLLGRIEETRVVALEAKA